VTIAVSLVLGAAGAVLIWGVDATVAGVDLDVVGAIGIMLGLIGFAVALMRYARGAGPIRDVGRRDYRVER
jgi:hypothetical protein